MRHRFLKSKPSSVGLVLDIPLTGGFMTGAILRDETGNGFDGTAVNSPILKYPGMDFVAASETYIDVGTGPTSVQTASIWIKLDDVAGSEHFLDLDSGSTFIRVNVSVIGAVGFASPVLYVDGVLGTIDVTTVDTEWHHIILTSSSSINAIGVSVGRRFGMPTSSFVDGLLSDVRLYNRVLSAEEAGDIFRLQRHKYQT